MLKSYIGLFENILNAKKVEEKTKEKIKNAKIPFFTSLFVLLINAYLIFSLKLDIDIISVILGEKTITLQITGLLIASICAAYTNGLNSKILFLNSLQKMEDKNCILYHEDALNVFVIQNCADILENIEREKSNDTSLYMENTTIINYFLTEYIYSRILNECSIKGQINIINNWNKNMVTGIDL